MAARVQHASVATREQIDFAQVWVSAWRRVGGFISADTSGRRSISYRLNRVDDETRGALRALLGLLDALPPTGRTMIFIAAMESGR